MALLALQGVSLSFGGLRVVSDLDLTVERGRDRLADRPERRRQDDPLQPDHRASTTRTRGEILLDGRNIAGLPPHKINQLGVARTFQTLRLFLNMSVKENVMAAAYGQTKAGPFRAMLRTPGMRREEKRDREARRGAALVLRRAADGLPLEPARVLALVREPAAARDRAGDGDPARGSSCSTSRPPG